MKTALIYLLEANLIFSIGYLYYRFFLAGNKRHLLNRVFLLSLPVAAFGFPLVQFSSSMVTAGGLGFVNELPAVLVGAIAEPTTGSSDLASVVYLSVASLLGLWSVSRIVQLFLRLRRGERRREQGYVLVEGTGLGPASFGPFLIWDEMPELNSESRRLIRDHELAHIRQWHSLDVLYMEVVRAICWFNPLIYRWSRDLQEVHEFLADAAASGTNNVPQLKKLILARTLGVSALPIANHFSSHTQKRIVMLNKSKSRKAWLAYALALPLMFGLFFSTSMVSAQDAKVPSKSEVNGKVDVMPKPLNQLEVVKKIGYPKDAEAAGLEGKVLVQYIVGKAGNVEEVKIIKSDHDILTKAVAKHADEMRFSRGLKDGVAVKTQVVIPFKFALNKAKPAKGGE